MSLKVTKGNHPIDMDTRSSISTRYKKITKAVNNVFWDSSSETAHSRYVGSYGRGTAIDTSDLDVLVELPNSVYNRFTSFNGNGQSQLLQAVKNSILQTYPNTEVRGDGQVVVVNFSDGMKFEILPAFRNDDILNWRGKYKYPDAHMGGHWLTTYPEMEQEAIKKMDIHSNGLLRDTCKHIRYIRSEYFSSMHLSGILIDSFVYEAIDGWQWLYNGGKINKNGYTYSTYEEHLLNHYNNRYRYATSYAMLSAPGSCMIVKGTDLQILEKVLNKMV